MKWNTQYNPNKVTEETFTNPSLTIPNEALSVREILIRYSRGLPIDERVPIYDEENDLLDPRKMDLADVQELREQYAAELAEIKQKKKEYDEAQARAEQEKLEEEKRFKQELEEFKKHRNAQSSGTVRSQE